MSSRTIRLEAFVLVVATTMGAALAETLRVPADYATIQAAIDAAGDGDEIVVAAGTYNEAINFNGRAVYLHSSDGPESTIIDATGIGGPVVVCISGEGSDTVLDGFTITGGGRGGVCAFFSDFGHWVSVSGGSGVFVRDATPTIVSCIITGNDASELGGGVLVVGGHVDVTSSTFSDNAGPAVRCDGGGFTLASCMIEENVAGIVFPRVSDGERESECDPHGGSGAIVDCVIRNNRGPGVMGNAHDGPVTIRACTVTGNELGIECHGCDIVDSLIAINSPRGGVYSGGLSTVTDCVILGNTSTYDGGGVYCGIGEHSIVGCTVVANEATDSGGGVATQSGFYGECKAMITNTIFWGNSATVGSQVGVLDARYGEHIGSKLSVAYSNVEGGQAAVYIDSNSSLSWEAGNIDADPLFARNPSDGGDGWGDDPDTPDFDERSNNDYGDLRLQIGSPCIDTGDPAFDPPPGVTDLNGLFRIWDGNADGDAIVDMGAYEFGSHAFGDLNCDGGVDFDDIDAFVMALTGRADYEQTYSDCEYLLADTNDDSSVDFADIDPFVECLINNGCD